MLGKAFVYACLSRACGQYSKRIQCGEEDRGGIGRLLSWSEQWVCVGEGSYVEKDGEAK